MILNPCDLVVELVRDGGLGRCDPLGLAALMHEIKINCCDKQCSTLRPDTQGRGDDDDARKVSILSGYGSSSSSGVATLGGLRSGRTMGRRRVIRTCLMPSGL